MNTRSITFAIVLLALSLLTLGGTAWADTVYGSCVRKDGSKCDGAAKISMSWNSKKAFPRNGSYELDLGGSVDKRITIYCNGSEVGTVYVDGDTRFDVVCR